MPDRDYLRDLGTAQAAQHEKLEGIEASCERIEKHLLGNGHPGLVVRTDRLEQKEKNRSKLLWMVVSGVVLLILNAAASYIGLVQ